MFVPTPPTSQLDRLALAIYASDARISKDKAYIMARLRLGIKKNSVHCTSHPWLVESSQQ